MSPPRPPKQPEAVCPLKTRDVVDRIMLFIEELTQIHYYVYQKLFMRRAIESVIDNDGSIITSLWSRQSGKCLARGTPVMMADGSTRPVEDIRVGDQLMGDDSLPRNVLSLARGREKMVRVEPIAGYADPYTVNASHILSVCVKHQGPSTERPRHREWVKEDIGVNDLLGRPLDGKTMGYKVGLDFPRKEVPIDPYWLGLWLGDGGSRDTRVTTADQEVVDFICDYAQDEGLLVSEYQEAPGNAASTFALVGKHSGETGQPRAGGNSLKTALQRLDLLRNKHIPSVYKINCRSVRLQLLAGLIDTDGSRSTCSGKENTCEITFGNRRLAEDTLWLFRSLGYRASIRPKRVKGKDYWRITAYGALWEVPTQLPRKQWEKGELREDPLRYGIRLTELPKDDYFGFEIDGNKRFLLGDFTVTHNTEAVAGLALGLAILFPVLAKAFPDDPRFKAYARGFRVGIYAPIDEQARLPYDRIRTYAHSEHAEAILSDPELDISLVVSRGDRIVLSNGSRIMSKTASPQASIEGDTHDFVICEESQKLLRSKVDKEIRPMLAATFGTMIHIGTAWESRGGFHHSIQYNVDAHRAGGKRNHFEYPYEIVIEEKERMYRKDKNPFHLNYAKFVQQEIARLGGTDNEEFKMNFRCLWAESRVIALYPHVLKAAYVEDMEMGPRVDGFQVAGLDIGKVSDQSVLACLSVDRNNPVINKSTLPGADEDKQVYYHKTFFALYELGGPFEGNTGQYATLVEILSWHRIQMLVVDATALGDPVFERIEAMVGDSIMVLPFKFGSVTKSLLYKYYLQEWNARRIHIAAGPETQKTPEFRKFQAQHLDLDRVEAGGYVICSAPDGGHDDYPDAGALACWAEKSMTKTIMPEIEVTSAPSFGGGARIFGGRGPMTDTADLSVGRPRSRYVRRGWGR